MPILPPILNQPSVIILPFNSVEYRRMVTKLYKINGAFIDLSTASVIGISLDNRNGVVMYNGTELVIQTVNERKLPDACVFGRKLTPSTRYFTAMTVVRALLGDLDLHIVARVACRINVKPDSLHGTVTAIDPLLY